MTPNRKNVSRLFCAALVLFAVALGLPLRAQVLYGTLLGNVTDPSGAPVAGATVTARNAGTGEVRTERSDERGFWSLRNLQPGTYRVRLDAAGFGAVERAEVRVSANSETRVDLPVAVQAVSQALEVSGAAPALQTDRGDVHAEITAKQIENLPLPGYRNYQSLLNLVPGATPARFQNALMDSPARSLTTNINGTSRNTNNTRIDGATTVFPYLPHHTLYNPPADSIESVNITTNNFTAEQGIAGGAAITVITKSGTNQMHGSAFEYHNDSAMAARNFFYLRANRPKNILNQFGATLGGPMVKNKLFYFGSYEGLAQRQSTSIITTVPTLAQRNGDFTGLSTIYDPATGTPDGKNRTAFVNNIVPLPRMDAAALKMQALVPLPNLAGNSRNYFGTGNVPFNRHSGDAKVNWNIDERSSIFGKYSIMDATVQGQGVLGAGGGSGLVPGGGSGTGHTRVQVGGVGYTRIVSPNIVVDGNIGFARLGQSVLENDYGKNLGLTLLGIPGTNGPDPKQSGLPSFAIAGYETFGNVDSWTPEYRYDNVYTYVGNAAWNKGAHAIRMGVDINHTAMNDFQPQRGFGPRGGFNFAGGSSALKGGAAPTQFNAYADFLLGNTSAYGKSYQYLNPMSVREWQDGIYLQDQWQATRRLTLTAGVRWEYYPVIQRAHRGIERYDLATNKVHIGCIGDVPCNAGTQVSKHQFAPRLGLAWRVDNNTVARGGFGISVDPYPFSRAMRDPYPVTVAQTINAPNSYTAAGSLSAGIPALPPIAFGNGIIDLPLDAYTKTLLPGEFRRGYVESFNVTLERRLPGDFVVSAGYVGTRSIRQMAFVEENAGQIAGAGAAGQPLFTAFGRKAQTQAVVPYGTTNYNSLQAKVERRFSGGLMLTAAYTWAKAIDFSSDSDNALMFNAVYAQPKNRAVSDFDRKYNFQAGFLAELPFGPKKPWMNGGGVASRVLADWQVNGIVSAYTGMPFTVTASGASLNMPSNTQVADQTKPSVKILGGVGSAPYFDTSAFAAVTQARFGNTGRNALRGPGAANLDLSLFRRFTWREQYSMEVRGEAFNLTNTAHFANPSGAVGAGTFGYITSTFGGAADARVLRVGMRLSF